jgi:phospholipase C
MNAVMPQIDTIVMLMLENRSLDTMLGWLYSGGKPNHVFPNTNDPRELLFNGIPPGAVNYYKSTAYSPANGTQGMSQPCRVPRWDPNEPFESVEIQLFADGDGQMPNDPWLEQAPMTGFAYDFDAWWLTDAGLAEVMGAYTAQQLPVLYGLAESFAVSDRWFSSIPTQTDANRAFSICGTSLGGLDNGTPDTYDAPTVFNAISGQKSWGVYWQYDGVGAGDPGEGPCYTVDIFPQIKQAGSGVVDTYQNFLAKLAAGADLPSFCYLEPFWGGGKGELAGTDFVGLQGNDYHPPAWIGPAENDLNVLYDALRKSKQWPSMLLIITFDEHGGLWDHVSPTATVAPDDNTSQFDFKTLGVRVPTILVSPYVNPGTVFRAPPPQTGPAFDFDHTSFIATILKWAGVDPATAGLGNRVAVAPTFEAVLSDTPYDNSPTFSVPSDYAGQGGGLGPHLLDVSLAGVPIERFREAEEQSGTVEEFKARLADLAARSSEGTPNA